MSFSRCSYLPIIRGKISAMRARSARVRSAVSPADDAKLGLLHADLVRQMNYEFSTTKDINTKCVALTFATGFHIMSQCN